jgi:hypothetical protein
MGVSPMTDVSDRVIEINKTLQGLPLRDVVEVLANVLISQGMNHMDISGEISEITPENVVDLVMTDKQQNGESLHNSLSHQGLVMLMWLRKR